MNEITEVTSNKEVRDTLKWCVATLETITGTLESMAQRIDGLTTRVQAIERPIVPPPTDYRDYPVPYHGVPSVWHRHPNSDLLVLDPWNNTWVLAQLTDQQRRAMQDDLGESEPDITHG